MYTYIYILSSFTCFHSGAGGNYVKQHSGSSALYIFFPQVHSPALGSWEYAAQSVPFIFTRHRDAQWIVDPAWKLERSAKKSIVTEVVLKRADWQSVIPHLTKTTAMNSLDFTLLKGIFNEVIVKMISECFFLWICRNMLYVASEDFFFQRNKR